MPATPELFGTTPEGRPAQLFTLATDHLRVRVTDYGGRMVSIEAPDRSGQPGHVLLGFDSVSEYLKAGGSFGAILGRTANRIANGRFSLDGHEYELSKNENGSTLHGGERGFGKVFWDVVEATDLSLVLRHTSPDGDQGFPGDVTVEATYRLDGDSLTLAFEARTTKPTPLSLSAHPYFNLGGPAGQDVLDHEVTIDAGYFLPTDERQIPTGEIRPVEGTVFDFRTLTPAGARIRTPDPQILIGKGYDHYFVLQKARDDGRPAARVREPSTGRVLELHTTQPGLQFYTGNNLNGTVAGRGGTYRQAAGFAFEPQGFPNAVNQPSFPSTVLRPGERYHETIRYRFTVE